MLTARRDEEKELERRREPLMTAPLLAGYDQAKETEKVFPSLQGANRDLQLHIAKGKEEKGVSIDRRDESTLRLARYEQAQEGKAPEKMEMELLHSTGSPPRRRECRKAAAAIPAARRPPRRR